MTDNLQADYSEGVQHGQHSTILKCAVVSVRLPPDDHEGVAWIAVGLTCPLLQTDIRRLGMI